MRRLSTQADLIKHGKLLASAVEASSEDLPYLEALGAQLASATEELQALVYRQGALASEKQKVSQRIAELMTENQKLISFLGKGVKLRYGSTSEKLTAFGLQPFRRRRRHAAEAEPQPDAAE